ncbi:MAG: lipopolysaccharide kinase InaA family protein [Kiritimatiellia bacterium]|nr:lipopolysaccharide kinase InaA family protein [Kiritimatiellia bacterium]
MKPVKIFYLTCLAAVLFCLLIWLSTAVTVGIMNLAQYTGGAIGTYLIDKGAERIMRRVLLAVAVIILILILKIFGWRGWKDCGWARLETGCPPRRWVQFLQGIVLGSITLGSIAALTIPADLHNLKLIAETNLQLAGLILSFSIAGLVVALVEETICRGILFRVFSRAWNAWTAALVTSIIFAAAHFIGPPNSAFQGDSFLMVTLNVTAATLASFIPPLHSLIRFINLTLLGIVLCAFVMRTKTIWMSVGAHAVWVLIIKLHSHFTVLNPAARPSVWLGQRNDFTDSLAAVFAFTILILLTLWNRKKTGSPVKIRGRLWHIIPSETDKLGNFLQTGEDLFSTGNVLKTYPGCRVISKDSLVFKKYQPKNFIHSLRFAFRPPRVKRAFRLAGALIDRGLPTPEILAWSAARRFGLLTSEAMIVSKVKNAEPLTDWLKRKTDNPAVRLKVMEAYGNLMADFHRHGYSNRDLKHENVMCLKEQPWLLRVVDLDGVRKQIFVSRRRAGKDLMRIGKSLASLGWTDKTEIAAFFGAYNSQGPARLRCYAFPEQ